MSSWTGPAFITALVAALDARAGLDGVKVFSAPAGNELPANEFIEFRGIEGAQDPFAFGKRRVDRYIAHGTVWSWKPGGGETIWTSARDRAAAIVAEIEDYLVDNHTVAGTVTYARMANIDLVQGTATNGSVSGRVAKIDFEIAVDAAFDAS